ncbi:MAG: NAD(P)-binding domain-containing protein, partial [Woeseiaceae bacterium]
MRVRPSSGILLIALTLFASIVSAETIAIIGTGNVASALGPEFAAQGHTVVYGSRNPDSDDASKLVAETGEGTSVTTPGVAVTDADVVVLAVPGMLVKEITEGLGDLAGKIVIDPTNPLIFESQGIRLGVATSNTRIIQDVAPDAAVVKAFNT